ncbi:DMT family transporter [Leucothrix pacifica]|uniref:EamA family transporter n=1 Tax=Leucothrix pacifica TaxID=1247513 RepID=A0A317CH57_9GAMM|nr:DMT family transporter [Leucothrix pacifica]PWQ96733.1 EamA family transporter [Leucothrix pacifica]
MPENIANYLEKTRLDSGLLLAAGGTAMFALKSIFIKLAYQEGVDTTTLLTLRMMLAIPFYLATLLWLIFKEHQAMPQGKNLLAVLGLGFIGYYLSSYLDLQGLNYISAQLERLTLYSYPIMTTLLGWLFLKDVITKRVMLSLLLTYSGVMILYWHEANLIRPDATIGVLFVMAAAFTFSCYVVFSKPYIIQLGSRLFTSIAMLASAAYALLHFGFSNELTDFQVNGAVWFYAVLLAFFCTVLPSFMVSEAIARIGPSKTSIVGTAGPVFTIMLAVILLGEPFGLVHFAGMVLVMLGVALLGKR